jgi:hypothetical protein
VGPKTLFENLISHSIISSYLKMRILGGIFLRESVGIVILLPCLSSEGCGMIVLPFRQVVATGQPRPGGCAPDGLPDETVAIF